MEEALRLLHARSTGTLSSSGINPGDIAWFLEYAVEPFYLLQQLHPHLNASSLPPPTNPFRVERLANGTGYFGKRAETCLDSDGSNNNNSNNSNTSSSKKPNTGVIVGGVVGGVAVLAILAFVICFCVRKRKKKPQTVIPATNPQMVQSQVPQVYNNPSPTMPVPATSQPYPYPINQPVLSHASSSWSGNEPLIGGMNNQSNPGSIGTNYMNMGAASSVGTNVNNNQQGGYYNYVPPPMEGNAAGITSERSNYSVTPAPTFQTTAASSSHPSQTPSPPPTSNYAVWAIPTEGSNSPPPSHFEQSVPPASAIGAGNSEKAQFLARDEKAQFSGHRPGSMVSSTRIQSPAPPYQPHLMGNH